MFWLLLLKFQLYFAFFDIYLENFYHIVCLKNYHVSVICQNSNNCYVHLYNHLIGCIVAGVCSSVIACLITVGLGSSNSMYCCFSINNIHEITTKINLIRQYRHSKWSYITILSSISFQPVRIQFLIPLFPPLQSKKGENENQVFFNKLNPRIKLIWLILKTNKIFVHFTKREDMEKIINIFQFKRRRKNFSL